MRIMSEYLEPLARFRRERIQDTVVFFGSARFIGMDQAHRQLKLLEAQLRNPERIDGLAQKMGLKSPDAGQVMRMEPSESNDNSAPVMARVAAVSVISAR